MISKTLVGGALFLLSTGCLAFQEKPLGLSQLNWGISQEEVCRDKLFPDPESIRYAGGEGLLAVAGWSCVGFAADGDSEPDLATLNWALEAADYCRSQVLPRVDKSQEFRNTHGLVATVAFSGCDTEGIVSVYEDSTGETGGMASVLVGESLVEQLQKIRATQPEIEVSKACNRLDIRSLVLENSEVLISLVEDLRGLRPAAVTEPIDYIHGSWLEVWITAGANESHFLMHLPGEGLDPLPGTLPAWAGDLFSILGWDCGL